METMLMSYQHVDWHVGSRQHYLSVSAKSIGKNAILKEQWLGKVWLNFAEP